MCRALPRIPLFGKYIAHFPINSLQQPALLFVLRRVRPTLVTIVIVIIRQFSPPCCCVNPQSSLLVGQCLFFCFVVLHLVLIVYIYARYVLVRVIRRLPGIRGGYNILIIPQQRLWLYSSITDSGLSRRCPYVIVPGTTKYCLLLYCCCRH